jgi:hypothetical protein
MKQLDKDKAASWPSTEQLEKLRAKLRRKLIREELESTLQLETVGHLITALNGDPIVFRQFWVQPLLAAVQVWISHWPVSLDPAPSQIKTRSLESPEAETAKVSCASSTSMARRHRTTFPTSHDKTSQNRPITCSTRARLY